MKKIFALLLIISLNQNSNACCGDDGNISLTESLFRGTHLTILTCKILTYTKPICPVDMIGSYSDHGLVGTASAEIIKVYFGNPDTTFITITTSIDIKPGQIYLIYSSSGRYGYSGGKCSDRSKLINENVEVINELKILNQFSEVFKNKLSGDFKFFNAKNIVVAEGKYRKGYAIKSWKHFYENGTLKSEYNLKKKNIVRYLPNGSMYYSEAKNKIISIDERESRQNKGERIKTILEIHPKETLIKTVEYYANGNLKKISSQIEYKLKVESNHNSGEYLEYYPNGNLKIKGKYLKGKPIGIWFWFIENGKLEKKISYKN